MAINLANWSFEGCQVVRFDGERAERLLEECRKSMREPEFRGRVEGATKRALIAWIRERHSWVGLPVVSVHMPTPHTERLSSCLALLKRELTSVAAFKKMPFVVGGDFNHNLVSL